jgi:hypothetical protein
MATNHYFRTVTTTVGSSDYELFDDATIRAALVGFYKFTDADLTARLANGGIKGMYYQILADTGTLRINDQDPNFTPFDNAIFSSGDYITEGFTSMRIIGASGATIQFRFNIR